MRVKIKGLVSKQRFYATVQAVAENLKELGIKEI